MGVLLALTPPVFFLSLNLRYYNIRKYSCTHGKLRTPRAIFTTAYENPILRRKNFIPDTNCSGGDGKLKKIIIINENPVEIGRFDKLHEHEFINRFLFMGESHTVIIIIINIIITVVYDESGRIVTNAKQRRGDYLKRKRTCPGIYEDAR